LIGLNSLSTKTLVPSCERLCGEVFLNGEMEMRGIYVIVYQ
jgi:hypothetical protein